jgi:hypothetical protein
VKRTCFIDLSQFFRHCAPPKVNTLTGILQGKMLGNYDNQPGSTGLLMKFSDLNIGQRFSYKGIELEKSGPLQATETTTGKPRSIMRAATVDLLNSRSEGKSKEGGSLDLLRQAFAAYHQTCLSLLQAQGEDRVMEVEAAYREIQQAVESLSQTVEQRTPVRGRSS